LLLPPETRPLGSIPSRGPVAVFPPTRAGSRILLRPLPSARLPPLPAQGMRALVPPLPSASPLLFPDLPAGGPSLAALAGRSALPRQRSRQAMPAFPKSTLSPATSSALRPDRLGHAAARGPAPSHNAAKFFRMPLRPTRLLPILRPIPALSRPALLFAGLPPGFTSRSPTRSPTLGATPPRRTTPAFSCSPTAMSRA
jgi:hypothetical protein